MKKERNSYPALESFLGTPKLPSSGTGLFSSTKKMRKDLDAFLGELSRLDIAANKKPSKSKVFGFIIKQLKVAYDPTVQDITVSMNPGEGIASVLIPPPRLHPLQDPQKLALQLHQIASIYFPSLPIAQIQAQIQLYCLLTDQAKKKLCKNK